MAVDPVQNALARNNPDELKFLKLLMSRSRTSGAEIEKRRIELANASLTLDSLTAAILRDADLPDNERWQAVKYQDAVVLMKRGVKLYDIERVEIKNFQDVDKQAKGEIYVDTKMSTEKLQQLLTVASVLGMSSIVKGQELIVDCVTVRERVKIKGGKYGHRRFTLGELVQYLVAAIGEEETDNSDGTGALGALEQGLEMLNDIGVKFGSFVDENGVPKPDKYFYKENEAAPKAEVEVDENEAVEEGTGTENSADDIIKKVKK